MGNWGFVNVFLWLICAAAAVATGWVIAGWLWGKVLK